MATPWMTSVAGNVADYYRSTQPVYNAARNRQRALERQDEIERQLLGELQTLDPNNPDYQGAPEVMEARRILREGLPPPMTSGVKQAETPELPALQFSDVPKIGVAPQPSSAPMLTVNPLYKREAADLVRELRPSGQGSSAEAKMSVSSSGATAAQQKESYDEYRRAANELVAKDRELAIKKARLALMQQSAARVKAGMYGTEEADAFDKKIEALANEVASTEAAREKARIKKTEYDANLAMSAKAAETQQAKIAVQQRAREIDDNWKRANSGRKLDLEFIKAQIQAMQEVNRQKIWLRGQDLQFAGSQGGLAMLSMGDSFARWQKNIEQGENLIRALSTAQGTTAQALFDKDPETVKRAVSNYMKNSVDVSNDWDFDRTPEKKPDDGLVQRTISLLGGGAPTPSLTALAPENPALSGLVTIPAAGYDPITILSGGASTSQSASGRTSKIAPAKKPAKASGAGAKPARASFSSGKDYIAAVSAWRKAGGKD